MDCACWVPHLFSEPSFRPLAGDFLRSSARLRVHAPQARIAARMRALDLALDDPDLLPHPDEVAAEIVQSLEAMLDRFRNVANAPGEALADRKDIANNGCTSTT